MKWEGTLMKVYIKLSKTQGGIERETRNNIQITGTLGNPISLNAVYLTFIRNIIITRIYFLEVEEIFNFFKALLISF